MVNYFVCPCMFDVFFESNHKEITQLIESGFLRVNFLIFEHDGSFYLCCKDNIIFCFDCQSDIYKTCSDEIEPVNCFDLILYGFEDICSKCEKLILKYFLDFLIKIEK